MGSSLKRFENASIEKSEELRQSERILWRLVVRTNSLVWQVLDCLGMERLHPTELTMKTLQKEVESQKEEALASSLFLQGSSRTYDERLADSIRSRMI